MKTTTLKKIAPVILSLAAVFGHVNATEAQKGGCGVDFAEPCNTTPAPHVSNNTNNNVNHNHSNNVNHNSNRNNNNNHNSNVNQNHINNHVNTTNTTNVNNRNDNNFSPENHNTQGQFQGQGQQQDQSQNQSQNAYGGQGGQGGQGGEGGHSYAEGGNAQSNAEGGAAESNAAANAHTGSISNNIQNKAARIPLQAPNVFLNATGECGEGWSLTMGTMPFATGFGSTKQNGMCLSARHAQGIMNAGIVQQDTGMIATGIAGLSEIFPEIAQALQTVSGNVQDPVCEERARATSVILLATPGCGTPR